MTIKKDRLAALSDGIYRLERDALKNRIIVAAAVVDELVDLLVNSDLDNPVFDVIDQLRALRLGALAT